ncbi:MAG: hypothetical protein P1U82_06970 [Verrucomicrobiales bacterium]|nr:hypothetical protein [Verrucomicrobiales bacterium]MDF1785596.1 hypothetical protein [Verrucomicrobiales bacterium]
MNDLQINDVAIANFLSRRATDNRSRLMGKRPFNISDIPLTLTINGKVE